MKKDNIKLINRDTLQSISILERERYGVIIRFI